MPFHPRPSRHTHPQRHQWHLKHKHVRRRSHHESTHLQHPLQRQLVVAVDAQTSLVTVEGDPPVPPQNYRVNSSVIDNTPQRPGSVVSSGQTAAKDGFDGSESTPIPIVEVDPTSTLEPSIAPSLYPLSLLAPSSPLTQEPQSFTHHQQPFDAIPGLKPTPSSMGQSPSLATHEPAPVSQTDFNFSPQTYALGPGSSVTHSNLAPTPATTFIISSALPLSSSSSATFFTTATTSAPPTLASRPSGNSSLKAGVVVAAALGGCLATILLLFGVMWLVRMRSRNEDSLEYLSSIRGDSSNEMERVPDIEELPNEELSMEDAERVLRVTNPGDDDLSLNSEAGVLSLSGGHVPMDGLGLTLPPDAVYGTPRVAAPRFMSVMRDGGLPIPPPPALSLEQGEKRSLHDIEANAGSRLSRLQSAASSHKSNRCGTDANLSRAVSSVYSIASEGYGYALRPSTPQAEGWAASLRSNLYAAIQRMASTTKRNDGYKLREEEIPEPWTKQPARPTSQRTLRLGTVSRDGSVRSTISLRHGSGVTPILDMDSGSQTYLGRGDLQLTAGAMSVSFYSPYDPSVLSLPAEPDDDLPEVELPSEPRSATGYISNRVSSCTTGSGRPYTNPDSNPAATTPDPSSAKITSQDAPPALVDGASPINSRSSKPIKTESEASRRSPRPFLRQRQSGMSTSSQSFDELK
ncbi:uncharacterized protein EI90DRAFT_281983 [Cantharellus anzutake]|uniref:uncharacterized protein n=1 Tax=Cantharellus anzutake TaxID=1750568 RepID=UPI001903C48E|nr:uncharacterized protein EI90DRAFT_281983 [Cantharellus anzutake]KAF8335962.1 hypothetical protein EI90DRAFT_281983 [Cantharellus anzutake]